MIDEGVVVITDQNQAGTVVWTFADTACVLLRNGELFVGPIRMLRIPQSEEDLAGTVLDVDRFQNTKKPKRGK